MKELQELDKEVAALITDIQRCGLYETTLDEQLRAFCLEPVNLPEIRVEKQFGNSKALFELQFGYDGRQMNFDGYLLLLPREPVAIAHQCFNGIDSAELEERMKSLDWQQHPGNFFDETRLNPAYKEMNAVLQDLDRFAGQLTFEDDGQALVSNGISDALMLRYFSGTPLEKAITGTVSYNLSVFYEVFHFPSSLNAAVAGNRINNPEELAKLSGMAQDFPKNSFIMNLNNLENLKEELKTLGFKDQVAGEMEKNMEKGVPEFTLNEKVPATRGQVDISLHFKQSGQSEHYFFNKFEVAHSVGKPLEEGQKYMVITPNEQGKNMVKSFENVVEAVSFFKEQKGNSELAAGKDAAHREKLATMEKGKVNYVAKEFQRTFRTPAVTQTFYVQKGRGFTAEQAANLIQGRSVYRDDLANVAGVAYKAWVKLDMDTPKDRNQNFLTNQYHDPSYGFNLEKVLDRFQIRELNDPAKKEALETELKNGNRPMITTVKDGQEVKMFIEAVPRYSQVNLYAENGKPEKREQFLKEPLKDQTLQISKGKGKEKELEEGMALNK
jgi:hypothetical protein